MAPETRKLIRAKAFSIYLKADPSILVERATRHNDRPLLQKGNPHEIMAHMLAEREPIYAEADITVESNNRPIDETVNHVLNSLYDFVYSDQKNPD